MVRFTLLTITFLNLFAGLAFSAPDFKVKEMGTISQDAQYVQGEILVKFKTNTDDAKARSINTNLGCAVAHTSPYSGVNRMTVPTGATVEEMVLQYNADPNVLYAEPNYIAYALMVPNDPFYSFQWHMPMINMEAAWDQSTGSGVIVAVVDGGVAYENYEIYALAPDLANTNFVQGYDFINNDSHPNDDNAHGTHVAGTIAQSTNNNLGVTGMAYNATIMPVKVLDIDGSGPYDIVADGVYFAANNGAKVINMSLGGTYLSTTLHDACIYAYNMGVTIVCAAGNSGRRVIEYPAAFAECISVGAVRADSTVSYYSTYNSEVDICAPGGDVNVDQDGDGYIDGVLQQTHDGTNYTEFSYYFYQGTSMAAPHVAGAAALLLAVDPSLTPAEVQNILETTAVDLGSAGWDEEYGYGMIDCNAALQALDPTPQPPVAAFVGTPTSGVAPLSVQFTDQSTYTPTLWSWTFGDGGTSTTQNPNYAYTSAGSYTVSLTVTNADGADGETKTNYITVTTPSNDPPVADFSGNPVSGNTPMLVNFTDLSTYSPTSWAWNFGDGGTSTTQNPNYTYTSEGTYTVSLTATNAFGSDVNTKTDYITVTTPTVTEVHVSDMVVIREAVRNRSNAQATITIVDQSSDPVSGATVTVYFTGPKASTYSGVTGANGQVTIDSKAGNGSAEWCAEVTNVSASGYTYNSGANDVTKACESGWVFAAGDGIAMDNALPEDHNLHQNYPNPFNPTTNISFTMPNAGFAKLQIFNVVGQHIETLVERSLSAGDHTFTWNASNMSSGIYLYRLETNSFTATKKMILMK